MFFHVASCLKKQNRFWVNEILELFNFSNANLKLTYGLSTSNAKVITYQSLDVKVILNTISSIDFKNIIYLFIIL